MKLIKYAQNEITGLMLDGWRVWKQEQGERAGRTILKNLKGEKLAVEWQFDPVCCCSVVRNRKVVKVQYL